MKDVRVFLACFFGALVGSIVARELSSGLWWIGSIAGFLTGYLSYELREIVQGLKKAWTETSAVEIKKALDTFFATLFLVFKIFFGVIINFLMYLSLVVSWLTMLLTPWLGTSAIIWCIILSIAYTALYCLMELIKGDLKYLKIGDIVSASPLFVFVYWLPQGIFLLLVSIPKMLRNAKKFFVLFLRYIHSDIRLLCGMDAAIGAAVGYFVGDVLIGALFGGVFGLLNYKVVRTYLLKPATAEAE